MLGVADPKGSATFFIFGGSGLSAFGAEIANADVVLGQPQPARNDKHFSVARPKQGVPS
jgi:hypothetical protein